MTVRGVIENWDNYRGMVFVSPEGHDICRSFSGQGQWCWTDIAEPMTVGQVIAALGTSKGETASGTTTYDVLCIQSCSGC